MQARPLSRMLSTMFDWAIAYAVALLFSFQSILAFIEAISNSTPANITAAFLDALITGSILIIFIIIYFLILPIYWKGQTVGKRFFRIRIVKTNGQPLDFQTMFIREVFGIILVGLASLGASVVAEWFTIALSDHHQSFHDILASTQVVDAD